MSSSCRGCAAAVAEVPVGEDQRGDARVGESLGVGLEPVLAGPAEAVAEDHQRRVLGVGHEQPGAALIAGRGEGDVEPRPCSSGHTASVGDLSLLCQLSMLRWPPWTRRRPGSTASASQVEQRGRVLVARLHGGPRGEFGPEIAADLAALVTRAETDDSVGAVVITGTHPERFVAHANLRWLQEGGAASPSVGPRGASAVVQTARATRAVGGSAKACRPHTAQRRHGAARRSRDVPADEPLRRGVHRRAQRLGARHRIRARAGLRLPPHGRRRPRHRPARDPARLPARRRRHPAPRSPGRHPPGTQADARRRRPRRRVRRGDRLRRRGRSRPTS